MENVPELSKDDYFLLSEIIVKNTGSTPKTKFCMFGLNKIQNGFNVFAMAMINKAECEICDENLNSTKYVDLLREVVARFLDNLRLSIIKDSWYRIPQGK